MIDYPLFNRKLTKAQFIEEIRRILSKASVKLVLKNSDRVMVDDCPCLGYFDPPTRTTNGELVVASDNPNDVVISTLAHEYMHFLQWFFGTDEEYDDSVEDNYFMNEHEIEINSLRLLKSCGLLNKNMIMFSKLYLKSMFMQAAFDYMAAFDIDDIDELMEAN